MSTHGQTKPRETEAVPTPGVGIDRVPAMACIVLTQCAEALAAFDDARYTAPAPDGSGGSVGKHVRHALDHFCALLEQPEDAIDYDRRDRGVPVETDKGAAVREIDRLAALASGLHEVDLYREVTILAMLDGSGSTARLPSTLGRELFFAVHHAIHHHAMIHALAHGLGVSLPAGFGKAPSTLDHERRCGGS